MSETTRQGIASALACLVCGAVASVVAPDAKACNFLLAMGLVNGVRYGVQSLRATWRQ